MTHAGTAGPATTPRAARAIGSAWALVLAFALLACGKSVGDGAAEGAAGSTAVAGPSPAAPEDNGRATEGAAGGLDGGVGSNPVTGGDGGPDTGSVDGGVVDGGAEQPWPPPSADMDGELLDVMYVDEQFVAVGTTGYPDEPGPAGAWILTSEDGREWVERYREPGALLYAVAHGDGRFVAAGWTIWDGSSGFQRNQRVLVSDDGIDWEEVEAPDGADTLERLVWTGSHFLLGGRVGVGQGRTGLWTSTDGRQWTHRGERSTVQMPELIATPLGVVLSDGWTAALSTDGGLGWTSSELGYTYLTGLWWQDDQIVASAVADCCFGEVPESIGYFRLTSADGLEWDADVQDRADVHPHRVATGPDRHVAVHSRPVIGGGPAVATAPLGTHDWQEVFQSPDSLWLDDVARGGGVYVAVGQHRLRWSEDGASWQPGVVRESE